jgi:hypothetical protein
LDLRDAGTSTSRDTSMSRSVGRAWLRPRLTCGSAWRPGATESAEYQGATCVGASRPRRFSVEDGSRNIQFRSIHLA